MYTVRLEPHRGRRSCSPRQSFVYGQKIDKSDPESKTVAFYGLDPIDDEARM